MRHSIALAAALLTLTSCNNAPPLQTTGPMAKAYVIGEITVTDPVAYEDYKAAIAPIVAKYGGRYLVRAGRVEPVEGEPPSGRVILFEFDSFDQAMAFERAPETLAASDIRHRFAKSRLFVVEGVPR